MRPTPVELLRSVCITLERDVLPAIDDPFLRTQVQLMIPALSGAAATWADDADRTRDAVRRLDAFLERVAVALTGAERRVGAADVTALRTRIGERSAVRVDADIAELRAARLASRALLAELLVVCERAGADDEDLGDVRTEAYALAAST